MIRVVRGAIAEAAELTSYAALDAARTLASNWRDCPTITNQDRIGDVRDVIAILEAWIMEIQAGTGGEVRR